MRDYYLDLEIKRTASPDEIRQAYYRLAKIYHPDNTENLKLDPDTALKFQRIKEAYDNLSDPQKRSDYDHQLSAQVKVASSGKAVVEAGKQMASALDKFLSNERVSNRVGSMAKNLSLQSNPFGGRDISDFLPNQPNLNKPPIEKEHKHLYTETDKGNLVCACGKELSKKKPSRKKKD